MSEYDSLHHPFSDASARAKAERLNCDILYSDDTTLLLDLDTPEAVSAFKERLDLAEELGFAWNFSYDILTSRSGRSHGVLDLRIPLPVDQRIALQAILGSDWKREMLSLAGLRKGQENPILLFRPRTNGE
jgi:hypothetical protein